MSSIWPKLRSIYLHKSWYTFSEEVEEWREKYCSYLDDGNYAELKSASDSIRADLITSGFVPNMQKSKWEP